MTEQDRRHIDREEFASYTSWVKDINNQLKTHTLQEVRMENRLDELEKDVKEIKEIVKDLRDVWTQSKGALRFLTVLVSVLSAGWIAVVWAKEHIRV